MPYTLIPASVARDRLASAAASTILLDVRQPEEVAIASVQGAIVIPMMEIPSRMGELDATKEILVMCHHGMRAQQVADYLARSGFLNVSAISGGIDAWAVDVDLKVPRY